MNNQKEETSDSKDLHINQFVESIQNDTKSYKRLLNDDQQNQNASLVKKSNNNCMAKSLNVPSRIGDQIERSELNDELLRSLLNCRPNDDWEKAREGEESSGSPKKLKTESSNLKQVTVDCNEGIDPVKNGNLQNFRRTFSAGANYTIEINHDMPHVGNIVTPKVFLCPVYTICIIAVIIAILVIYLFYTVMVYPGYVT